MENMEVTIDGVRYVPELPVCDKPHVLETMFMCGDLGREVTIREYLHELLQTMWREGESFSGKRPFGNSGWRYDLYGALVKSGAITGTLNEDGYVEDFDKDAANTLMPSLISEAFGLARKSV